MNAKASRWAVVRSVAFAVWIAGVLPAKAGVGELRSLVALNGDLAHHWTFDGASEGQRLADKKGSVNLSRVTLGSGTAAVFSASFGDDGQAARTYRTDLVNGSGYLTAEFSPANVGTIEYLFRAEGDSGAILSTLPAWRLYAGLVDTNGAAVAFGTDDWPVPRVYFLTADTTPDFVSGHWQYVAVTYSNDGSTVTFDVYTADLDEGQTTLSHPVQSETRAGAVTTSCPLGIGMQGNSGNNFFQGNVDEVAFYQSVLAEAVLQEHLTALVAEPADDHYVLVGDVQNNRVLKFQMDGTCVGIFADGFRPVGIQQGADGNVYIAEGSDHGAIRTYTPSGSYIANAFNGVANVTPDDIALNGNNELFFCNPFGTAADGVYRVDSQSSATEVLGDDKFNGPPRGIAFDADDNLLVADRLLTDGTGELESFDRSAFASNGTLITDEPFIQAPICRNGSIFYTMDDGTDQGASLNFVVREIDASTGAILNTYDHPTSAGMLLDTILLPDGDLLVSGYVDDAVYRVDRGTGSFSTFASGSYGGTVMDGPLFMAVVAVPRTPRGTVIIIR